jgi:hypothetical protein
MFPSCEQEAQRGESFRVLALVEIGERFRGGTEDTIVDRTFVDLVTVSEEICVQQRVMK